MPNDEIEFFCTLCGSSFSAKALEGDDEPRCPHDGTELGLRRVKTGNAPKLKSLRPETPINPEGVMAVRVVVAAEDAYGNGPDLYFCKVQCRWKEYWNGDHYEAAKEQARKDNHEGMMVAIDEFDPPRPVFKLFEWGTATLIVMPGSELK